MAIGQYKQRALQAKETTRVVPDTETFQRAQQRAYVNIAMQMRAERERQELTMEQLALASGLSLRGVARLEEGKHSQTIGTLVDAATALGKRLKIELVD